MILIIFGSVAIAELPGIAKKKQWKEFAVYSVFLITALVVTVMDQIFEFKFTAITRWFVTIFS